MSLPEPHYRIWQRDRLVVGGRTFLVATKPGVTGHGRDDTSTTMLAEALADCADQTVVSMPCGNGAVGAVAAGSGARRVYMLDRNVVCVHAANETLAANDLPGVAVRVGQGASRFPTGLQADIVAIRVVPEAHTMKHLIHDARQLLRPGGLCLLAGANDEGAKSAARMLERIFGTTKTMAQRRGHRLVGAVRPQLLMGIPEDLRTPFLDPGHFHVLPVRLRGHDILLHTRPGVFSWQHLDEASILLAENMDIAVGERVLDLGCGAGPLGIVAALESQTGAVTLVDADSESVRCAQATVQAMGLTHVSVLASDITDAVSGQEFDVVISNPPFHVGKHTDLAVPRQFIRDAFQSLRSGGRLLLVANRTLPYERVMSEQFGNVATRVDGRRFKVLASVKS